ncbi:GNAT family N-acetyltransferase [Bacillus pseudomycoides]|uniref:Alanine acetyltransferase n=1 Tax=Bacillus pseudomycoides TaxID=64104 RepID=A0ABD6T2H5_9BACI|nr:GNAT family protein [Bacillus pseudomycoides]PEP86193.1 alanine acetyltransferase [Bacillus pseudomycoides]PFW88303.1 alanine acetyltransferase [Bacillus pseudomycoides]PGF06012.1 alanine acetyltransferase [Bacillus pseudomycoides]PHE87562.1 alanine acetyltransferase [Bacillus pseudomycoides]
MNIEMVFGDFPVLESVNLVLRKIEEVHLQEVYSIYDNDKVFEYCGIIPKHNLQTVRKMIGHFDRDYHKKSRIKWGIFQKNQSDKLVGIIESMDFNQKVNMVSIGYFLAEDYWGKGIATESVRMVVKFLFEEVNVNRIQAEVMPVNEVSKKVLLKNGFIKEGVLRQASLWSGKGVIDLEIYGILKEDYIQNFN